MRSWALIATLALIAGGGFYFTEAGPAFLAPKRIAERADPAAVEASLSTPREAMEAGRVEEALLHLRPRAQKGPHAGAAHFLLGEIAYTEQAYGEMVAHYVAALAADGYLAAPDAPFGAGEMMRERARWAKETVWANTRSREVERANYLLRRLSGGCE